MTGGGWARYAYLRLLRLAVHTVGRSSESIRLCLDEGLTSGTTLDYIYRNEPSGRWLVGPLIDRYFLGQPPWQAIRTRRENLEAVMGQAIAELRREGGRVALLDVASGPAGYVLSVLAQVGEHDVRAVCRDLEPRWLAQGAAEAERLGLEHVQFEIGDAFDRASIESAAPSPNLVVSSGFYDWILDDEMVRESMAIIYDALEPGGFFALTNQAGHFDLELVEYVFTDFHSEPLRMTVRPTERVEAWLTDLGFRIEETRLGEHGYYSVSLVRKHEAHGDTSK